MFASVSTSVLARARLSFVLPQARQTTLIRPGKVYEVGGVGASEKKVREIGVEEAGRRAS